MAKPVEATLGYISLNRLAVCEIIQMDANFVALINIYKCIRIGPQPAAHVNHATLTCLCII